MPHATPHRRALCAAFAATGIVCTALGVAAAAAVAKWAAGKAPIETMADPLPAATYTARAGIHRQASSQYPGGIMANVVNG
jgi:hypothetical protein